MPRYAAVLDACVLVPVALADTLLRIAEKGLYRPLWTERILTEAQEAIEEIHPGIDVHKRFTDMRETFDDAFVAGWEELETGIRLPDDDDRHVVAAAIRGGAQAIVTANVTDFPADLLEPLGLEAILPDAFLLNQLDATTDLAGLPIGGRGVLVSADDVMMRGSSFGRVSSRDGGRWRAAAGYKRAAGCPERRRWRLPRRRAPAA
jgi:PIN domain